MSHIIPYIPTEPPSIHEDSFEQHSSGSEISDFNSHKLSNVIQDFVTEENLPNSFDQYNYENYTRDVVSRSPLELREHIDSVISRNDVNLDFTDDGIKIQNEDDAISECSFEGQFDAYIDNLNNEVSNINSVSMECMDTFEPNTTINTEPYFSNILIQSPSNNKISNVEENESEFDEFGDFILPTETSVDYFVCKDENIQINNKSDEFAFGDFDMTDSVCANNLDELEDDFDDFATFHNEPNDIVSTENPYQISHTSLIPEKSVCSIVELFHQRLMSAVASVDIDHTVLDQQTNSSAPVKSDSFISNNPLINEYGAQIWKELTNFDYSPAFIFHWMQSISYENFMYSMGPDYKELLSSQRATLPLYSVNLTPIEPVQADSFVQTIHSTTSSSLDLTIPEKSTGTLSEKNSSIDIKNLEDEFIFNGNIKDDMSMSGMKSDNRSSLPNLSSAVIQSEGLGGIFKSILKPLNSGKSTIVHKPINAQTEAVLRDLPDLSYMSSKVLMFPVLASCDIEDNI